MSPKYFFILFIGTVYAQSDLPVTLPPELQGKINQDQINEIRNKSTEALKELCEKNGGPDAYPRAENAYKDFTSCLSELVDTNELQEEIEQAKPTGRVDEVFKKYCDKTPSFKECFLNLTESFHPCVTPEEQGSLKTVYNISEQLAEFICFKDGDRIALFIAEHGPECLQEKQEEIQDCVNKTLGGNVTLNTNDLSSFNVNSIPKIQFGKKECNQLSELQKCVVNALESCSSTTSANIMEALFKFIRKATPCGEIQDKETSNARKQNDVIENKKANSASSMVFRSILLSVTVVSLFL